MKKLLVVVFALAAIGLTADWAQARGGGRGRSGVSGRGNAPRTNALRRRNKKKDRAQVRERALAENRDALLRDSREDCV